MDALADVDQVHRTGITAVEIAAFSGSMKVLQVLTSAGADLDHMDRSDLLLVQHRLKINTVYGDHEDTALHLAVAYNYRNVAEALAKKGADVDACDRDGDTPLQWAVENGRLDMSKVLLRNGAQVNKQNEKTGDVVLHWAVRRGHVVVTELLLARGADPCAVDLNQIQKSESVNEEDFATCKILVETASASDVPKLPQTESSPSSTPTELERKLSPLSSPGPEKCRTGTDEFIRYEVLDIPKHSAAERALREVIGSIEHGGVVCDGLLCKGKTESIKGARFKCALCENTDFCSACIASFHNNHDATHTVIRCFLPTQFHIVKEIDNKTKKAFLEACGEPSAAIEDLSHVLYALPDKKPLRRLQLDLAEQRHQKNAEIEQLLQDPNPTIFPVLRTPPTEYRPANKRNGGIISYGDDTQPGTTAYYKVDEAGNVRVKSNHEDEPESTPR